MNTPASNTEHVTIENLDNESLAALWNAARATRPFALPPNILPDTTIELHRRGFGSKLLEALKHSIRLTL